MRFGGCCVVGMGGQVERNPSMRAERAGRGVERVALAWLGVFCAVLVGCDLTSSGKRKEESGVRIGQGDRLIEPERCALTVVILSRPQGDRVLGELVWQAADEQVVEPELRRALEANGVRIGRITGDLPAELGEVLRAGPPHQPDVQTILNPSGQSALIDPGRSAPRAKLNLLLSQPDGKVHGKVYEDAKAYLRVTPTFEGERGVALRFVPELHHGPVQHGFGVMPATSVPQPREFRVVNGQQEEAFRALGVKLTLEPGQVAVVGQRRGRSGGLGELLFERPETSGDRPMESLILVWAARNRLTMVPGSGDEGRYRIDPPAALVPVEVDEAVATEGRGKRRRG